VILPADTFVRVTFCRADNPVAIIVPTEIFVFNIFVLVIFTVVKVPPTTKFPDKLKFAPVIVVPDNVPALIFVPTIFVAESIPELTLVDPTIVVAIIDPELIAVPTIFVAVAFVADNIPELTLVDPTIVVAIIDPELTFVTVAFVADNIPELTLVDPTIVVALIDPELNAVPTIFVAESKPELTLVDPTIVVAIRTPAETELAVTLDKLDNPDALKVPEISTVDAGTVVLKPTFPFVKYTLEFICESDIDAAVFIYIIYL